MSSVSAERLRATTRPRSKVRFLLQLLAGCLVLAAGCHPLYAAERASENAAAPCEFVFRGNQAESEDDLRKAAGSELADFEHKGQRAADADDAAFQMERFYHREGFASAEVDYEIERAGPKATVIFTIREGPRVLLQEITISGNEAVTRESLMPFFQEGRTIFPDEGATPFVKSDIESAASSIRDFYLAHGYRDVVVETPQYRFSENRDRVDILLRIREGMRYEVRSVDYRGDVTPDARLALEELKRKTTGQPYTSRTRMLVTAGVAEIYGNLGYPDAVVDVSERTDAGGQVGLDAAIAKGPLVTVADVSIRGNQRTNEEFIRRRLKLKAGDRYNQALEKASFRELYKSGVFSKVEINLEKTAVADRRVLAVTVQEAPSLELSFEPGYGAYEKLRLTVGLREKNLFGTGRAWKSEGLVSFKDQRISTSLSDPWFLDTDFRADLTLAAERREEPSFTSSVWGSDFTLTKDLGPHLSATAGYSFRNTQLTGVDVDIEEVDAGKNYNIATVKTQLTYDTRNDLFFPTTGQRTIGGIEHADTLLGGEVTLTRLTAGTRFFFPLTRSTVLGLRYSTGLIIPGTDETTVPLPERFFNGGENTVRSFKESELGPQNSKNNPAGGLGYNVASMELRQRLYGNFTGSLFTDIGNVAPNRTREEEGKPPYRNRSQVLADTLGDFFSGFRSAVGFGVQYLLPVGPARLDVAFNPDRDTSRNEDLYVIVFSVGWAF